MRTATEKTNILKIKGLYVFLFLLASMTISGCASAPLVITTPAPDQKYEVLGEGYGQATGIMLFNFIPIRQNQRFVRAYNAAVQSKGGDRLINPTIKEQWFWAYIMNGYITSVSGTVVKDIQ